MSRNNGNEEVNIAKAVLNNMSDDQVTAAKRFFDRFSEYKKFVKLQSVYIEGARTALKNTGNGRIYSSYRIDGTVTGRISNSGANVGRKKDDKLGVSFHTLPRESLDINIRDYVVAPEGHDFIGQLAWGRHGRTPEKKTASGTWPLGGAGS